MMKSMRYVLTVLIGYAAFWGAAHVGMLPALRADTTTDMPAKAAAGVDAAGDMWRQFLIIR